MPLLIALFVIPASAKPRKKAPALFPDGTPIPAWFSDTTKVDVNTLGQQYVITDFGVKNDSTMVQTEAIQHVIDLAADKGGGVVVIPRGTFLSGSLFFKQGTHLHVVEGGKLKGSERIRDFKLVDTRMEGQSIKYFAALVNADNVDGFTISGQGTIDGNGHLYWGPFWTNHVYHSDHIRYIDCYIYAPTSGVFAAEPNRGAPSSDAIDIDYCHDVLVHGCYMNVNDDAVVLKGGKGTWADKDPKNGPNYNIIIEDCTYGRVHGCLTLGSESVHDRNVILRRCHAEDANRVLWLKMRPDTPQHYEYVTVEDFTGNCGSFLVVRPWTQFFKPEQRDDMPLSQCNNIVMRGIRMQCKNFFDVGTSDKYHLIDFTFENSDVQDEKNAFDKAMIANTIIKNLKINSTEIK